MSKEEAKCGCKMTNEESAWERTKEISDEAWHKAKDTFGNIKHKMSAHHQEEDEEENTSCNKHMH